MVPNQGVAAPEKTFFNISLKIHFQNVIKLLLVHHWVPQFFFLQGDANLKDWEILHYPKQSFSFFNKRFLV